MALLSAVVRWSLRNQAVVVVATLVFALFGVRAAVKLPIDAVPDVTNTQVQILTTAPALSPVEMEQYVSIPVERAMAGIPRTTEVRSLSKYGTSVVTVVFEDGVDIYWARQLVNERMREAANAVPVQYGTPQLGATSSGLGEIYQFVVRNERLSLMQLEEVLEWQIRPALRTVPGIVDVNIFGGAQRQYQVVLDPSRLQAAGVSVAQVVDALERSNANAGGGYIEHNREHFVIGTNGLVKDIDDVRRVVIGATPQGVPITIATVGDVEFGPRLPYGAASKDGRGEVVIGVALMLIGENARTASEGVKDKLAALQSSFPPATTIEPFYDRSGLMNRAIRTVATNLLEGAALVIAVLFLLLGDMRAGTVVATTIPLSLLFAVIVMNATGLSGNLMSLGAIDFGLIVDGAVIIVENAVRRLSERSHELGRSLSPQERLDTIQSATLEVRAASVFGEAIIAIVYLPVLTLTGLEGKLFRPMAITVLLALAGAFVLSLTRIPVLASLAVREKAKDREAWLLRIARRAYLPSFRWILEHRVAALSGAVLLLGVGIAVSTRIGAEFVPKLDEGDLLVEARRLTGIALSESVETDARVQRALADIPEIRSVVSKTGAPEPPNDPMGVQQTDIYLGIKDRNQWRRGLTKDDLARAISDRIAQEVPEVGGFVSQPIEMRTNELVAGIRSDVAAVIYGPDLEALMAFGDRVASLVRDVCGAEDVRVEQVAGLKHLRVIPDRAKLARYGLSVADVNQIVETIAVGHPTGEVFEGERRFSIVVRVKHDFAGDLDPLLRLPLRSLTGQIVPLGDVAELKFTTGPAEVSRRSQSRRILVEFNVRGRDMLGVVEEAKQKGAASLELPTGYRIEWGGEFQHYEETRSRLFFVVPLALALIGFLLWLAFHSVTAALIIFLNVPFAVVGGVVMLALRGIPFSISAGVGFVALFGVAVLNGLVLVSFARSLEEDGASHLDAITRAAELRLRPVLMTALVASLGFVPMALSTAPGSEVQRPLATVVIGGLVTATLLTLYVLPVVYAYLGRGRVSASGAR